MSKVYVLLVCIIMVSAYDVCRRSVKLNPTSTCGQQQTMFNEGECLCCYYDTVNIPTIGIGFNLKRSDAGQVMSKYGLTLDNVLKDCTDKTTNNCLTDQNAKDIFNTISYPEFEQCVDNYASGLPTVKRAAIIDVAFAGCKTLNKFVKMQAALKNKDWETAGEELRNSLWCKQVGPNRCNSDYSCIVGPGCTGQTCGSFTPCSGNCFCFKASDDSGHCISNFYCNSVSDCINGASCSSSDHICIVDSCCQKPVCAPNSSCNNSSPLRLKENTIVNKWSTNTGSGW